MLVPKYNELMKPLLLAVQDGSIYKIKDVTTTLARQFKKKTIIQKLKAFAEKYFGIGSAPNFTDK